MRKVLCVVSGLSLLLLLRVANAQTEQRASWRQVVGILLAGNVVGSGTGKVAGGFLPWTTTAGSAQVDLSTGEIRFTVRGLVFAGGAPGITIGTPGPVTAVNGTLVCDVDGSAGGGNSVLAETPSVPLSATGDARFSGQISLPSACSSEADLAFLIRVTAFNGSPVQGPWIANGAVLVRGGEGEHQREDE